MRGHAVKSVSLLWLSSLGATVAAFFTQLIVARAIGPANYGVFSAALTTATLAVPLGSFGAQLLWLQLIGEFGQDGLPWLRLSIRLVATTTVCVGGALLTWSLIGPHETTAGRAMLFLVIYFLGQVSLELVTTKLQLEDQFVAMAAWQLVPFLVRLILALSLVRLFPGGVGPSGPAAMYAIVSFVTLVFAYPNLRKVGGGRIDLAPHFEFRIPARTGQTAPSIRGILRRAWPLVLSGLFYLVYFQGAVVMLSYLASERETGIYAIAANIMAAVYLFPIAVFQKFLLPRIQRWASHDPAALNQIYRRGCRWMFLLGCFVSLVIWTGSPFAIGILYGNKYLGSVEIIRLLCLCAPARFVTICIGSILSSEKLVRAKMIIMSVAAFLCVLGNQVLIPRFGVLGATWTTIFVEVGLLVLFKTFADHALKVEKNTSAPHE